MWVEQLRIQDVRNIKALDVVLSPGVNVFVGENAQGKTSVLEAVGLLARGRSFRSDDSRAMIRRGCRELRASATARERAGETALAVEISGSARTFHVNGRKVAPREYHGRLQVAVYSSERLRVIHGSMRDRRNFIDRSAAALWPSYQQTLRDFERTLEQRNAALQAERRDLETWDEQFARLAGELRVRRGEFCQRLNGALAAGFRPRGESYALAVIPEAGASADEEAARTRLELRRRRGDEQRAGRSLVGPQRDSVRLSVDGEDAAAASSGQARSLLLALTLATLDVYQGALGVPAVALLDDLDSELDDVRGRAVCQRFAERGQALVTTAHPASARALADGGRVFAVAAGEVTPA